MANAGGDLALAMTVTDENGKDTTDCEYKEIALDGVYLDAPRSPPVKRTFLVPGCRSDWLIKCSKPGTYKVSMTRKNENRTLSNALKYSR